MDDQTKLTVHFLVSKLVIFAVPILNQLLALVGITVTTSNSTADSMANLLCIGFGLWYSWWVKQTAVKTPPPQSGAPTVTDFRTLPSGNVTLEDKATK